MNYLFDSKRNRILGYRDMIASPEIIDKSASHLNTLFSKYIQKYNHTVDYLLIANIYCDKTKVYYNSIFDCSELQTLEEIAENGTVIEISYFAIYEKQKYSSKQEVIEAYEKGNFEELLNDSQQKGSEKDKETQKIKKVWFDQKDKVDNKASSQGNSQESNFYKNKKVNSIASFFKKPV